MHVIPPFDRAAIMIEVDLLLDWYLPAIAGRQATAAERAGYAEVWNAALDRLADTEQSLLLRDYHSPNIIWRAEKSRQRPARPGRFPGRADRPVGL